MSFENLDSSGKIDKFLLGKKEQGLSPEKVKIYLNLLKFFTEHLSKSHLVVEELKNPVDAVMEVKFEGLDPDIQNEYLQLFLDYISFCKKLGEGYPRREPKQPAAELKKTPTSSYGTVKCPKCGLAQGKRSKCIRCGARIFKVVEGSEEHERKYSKKTGIRTLLLVFLGTGIALGGTYLINRIAKEKPDDGTESSLRVIMDKDRLKEYSLSMKDYLVDAKAVIEEWRHVGISRGEWEKQHELALANMAMILSKVKKITPPKEFRIHHKSLVDLNQRIVRELEKARVDLKAMQAVSERASRSGRIFNSVNILMADFAELRNKFIDSEKLACRFNNIDCGF